MKAGPEDMVWQESRIRKLAGLRARSSVPPSTVISMLHATTGFRYVDSTKTLNQFMSQFSTFRSGPECRVPLGFFHRMPLDFVVRSPMIDMFNTQDKWFKLSTLDGHGPLAPAEYFCIAKCRLQDGSLKSADRAKIPMEDEEAGISSGPARMVSAGSDESEGRIGSRSESRLTSPVTSLEFALSQPFYNLGELREDYVVAVSLHDYSLWLIYNARDSSHTCSEDELEDGTEMDDDAYFDESAAIELESKRWFRPDYDPD
ncbi:MAG: hypothetical protein M1826_004551 [Phylliscum demangeonii]|nr:MAG: hypothetical protein M1826_004551 [Phylliscum demangeonii]